jgi:hypothetical protein
MAVDRSGRLLPEIDGRQQGRDGDQQTPTVKHAAAPQLQLHNKEPPR